MKPIQRKNSDGKQPRAVSVEQDLQVWFRNKKNNM